MLETILWILLAFFGAFGLVEFVRFAYTDWNCSERDFYVIIPTNNDCNNIEGAIRNAIIATDTRSLIVLSDATDSESIYILEKLHQKYEYIKIMSTDEYIRFLKNKED